METLELFAQIAAACFLLCIFPILTLVAFAWAVTRGTKGGDR